jgi:hypothetical protein
MHIRRHQLKVAFPGDSDGVLVGRTCLVVEDLKINRQTTGRQTCHDGVVCFDAVLIAPGLEGLLKDEVPIGVVGNHYILVARTSFHGEPACIIGVELADGKHTDDELVGRGLWDGGWSRQGNGGLGLGRPDILALLGEMAQDGLIRVGAVP